MKIYIGYLLDTINLTFIMFLFFKFYKNRI